MYLFFVILFIFCLMYVQKVRSSRLYKMVFKLPAGLVELPIFGSAFNFLGNSEDTMKTVMRATYNTMKLGGASRFYVFNLFYIALTDASDITEVLTKHLDKDYLYTFMQEFTGNGSAFAPAAMAKVRRQITTPSFSPRVLNTFVDLFWEESVRLTEVLAPHAGAGPFSVEEYLNAWSFGTIIKTMGVKKTDEVFCTSEYLNTVNNCGKLCQERMSSLWMHPNFLHKFSSNYTETQRCIKILYDKSNKVLKTRRNELKDFNQLHASTDLNKLQGIRESIFDNLIKSKLSDQEISEEILILIGATDLTGLSVGFTLMLLGLYPSVQDKVYKELQDVFSNSDRPLVKDDLNKLNYLDMVIKESLRLYPPAPFVSRNAHEDLTLSSGRIIPAGAGVVSCIIGLHRNPKYWGPEAEHFDPDRFLPERFAKVHPNAYMPFSYGARNCIGYKYGQMAMKAAISTILRKYKIVGEPAPGPTPNIRTKFEISMKSGNNFEIELVNRI